MSPPRGARSTSCTTSSTSIDHPAPLRSGAGTGPLPLSLAPSSAGHLLSLTLVRPSLGAGLPSPQPHPLEFATSGSHPSRCLTINIANCSPADFLLTAPHVLPRGPGREPGQGPGAAPQVWPLVAFPCRELRAGDGVGWERPECSQAVGPEPLASSAGLPLPPCIVTSEMSEQGCRDISCGPKKEGAAAQPPRSSGFLWEEEEEGRSHRGKAQLQLLPAPPSPGAPALGWNDMIDW
ncbi:unnamed protein product [Pipistrellus nathusii]|uniref:Uncharacterized protein n=1 Tax=Pipistrellus nathusii TaxID=59473 RepID=A0ABP0AHV9_PIPNA